MRLRYANRAKDDLHIAFEWYEEQRRGLGFEFLDCVEASIETIQEMPKFLLQQQKYKTSVPKSGETHKRIDVPISTLLSPATPLEP